MPESLEDIKAVDPVNEQPRSKLRGIEHPGPSSFRGKPRGIGPAEIELLQSHGVKPTRQRLDIARVLFARHQHLSADQVMARVNLGGGELSKATIYNTLKLFVEKHLVREVIVDPEKVFYDSNTSPHHHFFDVESGEIIDIDGVDVKVIGLPPLPAGRVTEGVDVVVRMRRE